MGHKGIRLREEVKIDKIFSFLYYEMTKDYSFSGERHDFWELVYVDQGCIHAIRDDEEVKLSAGEVIIHQPGEYHGLHANGVDDCNVFIISFSSQSRALNFLKGEKVCINHDIQQLFNQLYHAGDEAFKDCRSIDGVLKIMMKPEEDMFFAAEQVVKLYLELLVIQLIRQVHTPQITSRRVDMLSSSDLMEEIDDLLLENFHRKNYLDFLVGKLGVSKRKIQYLVRDKRNMSVNAYIRLLKIEKAKALLRERKKTVTEIADALGYSSVHYFSSQFKQECNMTPTEYSRSIKYKGHGLTFSKGD
ncbi:helix-turn-helix domain-containing protein [Vallitalea okinawensis]|uniref:helix-turn-helix domain-containing protein n=1 Tax=Vallitalea okinawensis TaxID=2078660 RepID=UPI000CFDA669|nr:AraC family transcriptional regulator [Vallitalea okinawensis]